MYNFLKFTNSCYLQEILSNWGHAVGLRSVNQSTKYFYAAPSRDSEIFAALEEKDKEILALNEQNMKILHFMRSKFSDFLDDL